MYDVTDWLHDHPGGMEVLLQYRGGDATMEYHPVQHSDPAVAKRETYLVGEIVAAEHVKPPAALKSVKGGTGAGGSAGGAGSAGGGLELQVEFSDVLLVVGAALYGYASTKTRAVPAVTYSLALRHAHSLMGIGAVGSLSTITAAQMSAPGPDKKAWMDLHKGTGVLMLVGILARIAARAHSPIPPRFQAAPELQSVETASHYLAYALMSLLPLTGLSYAYLSGGGAPLPFLGPTAIPGKAKPTDADYKSASSYADMHRLLGKLFKYGFVPFHVAIAAYHFNNGRDVVKKITPWI